MKTPRLVLAVSLLLPGLAAHAQIGLPAPPLPQVAPQLPLPELRERLRSVAPVVSSVRERARALAARYPQGVERDPRGAPMVRAVIVALAPTAAAIERARAAGYGVLSDTTLAPWDERLVTLLVPRGTNTGRALRELRAADPQGSYDFDHLFVESALPVGAVLVTGATVSA